MHSCAHKFVESFSWKFSTEQSDQKLCKTFQGCKVLQDFAKVSNFSVCKTLQKFCKTLQKFQSFATFANYRKIMQRVAKFCKTFATTCESLQVFATVCTNLHEFATVCTSLQHFA